MSAPPTTTTAPAPATRSHRTRNILLSLLAVLIVVPLIAIVILLTYDWNKARPWLNAKATDALDRPVAIRGNLSVKWEQPSRLMAGQDKTWRDYIPWPHLIAQDVHVGNPAGMVQQDAASISEGSFSLNPFSLLKHKIVIPVLAFQQPRVELLRTDGTHNNWTFKKHDEPSRWELDIERVVLAKGVVKLDDDVTRTHIVADVDTLPAGGTYGVAWKVRGSYNGAPVTGGGKAGAVLSLKNQSTPFPIQADMRSGQNHVIIEGTATRPAQLAAIDLKLKLAGASMAHLYNFTGVLLPETPPFSTEGRLVGSIDNNSSRWTYDNFTGKVGSSDINGKLTYQTGKPRGALTGNVNSKLLQFSDLGPLVGADSNASKKERGADVMQPSGKVLPVEQFRTDRWKSIDADVRYAAERIVRGKALPITKLSTHLTLKDGVMSLAPLDFGLAGGDLRSTIRMDGNHKTGIEATAKVAARHISIKQLFPTIEKMQATVGEINGDAQLSAVGNSVSTLLAKSNGEVKTTVAHGAVSKLLLEEMGLNVGNIVVTKLFGDKQVKLNCMVTDFRVDNGLMSARQFVVDTDEALINVDGTINLANEELDLILHPETKSLRTLSLRAPLYVKGPFSKPKVSVDKKVLAMKAGGAALLATIAAPLAAIVPLTNTGPDKNADCAALLADVRTKPVAPPPGKRAKK